VPTKVHICGKEVSLDRVDMFERYDRELTSITYSHGTTTLIIKRANRYFPLLAPILKANDIPLDFLYLACIESSLNPRAYSGAKAAGMWQFLAATAKQYGLEVSDEVDERYDPEKATEAACRYLKAAYQKYGDWPTVMASYNGGMGKAICKQCI
jgi:membrane-bound lytic murein transglycosylase MltF